MTAVSFPYEYCIALDIISTTEIVTPLSTHNKHLTYERSEIVEFSWVAIHFSNKDAPTIVHSHRGLIKPRTLSVSHAVTKDSGITQLEVDDRGVTLAQCLDDLAIFINAVVGTSSLCLATFGRWDIPVILRSASEAEGVELAPYLLKFFDMRDLFNWAFTTCYPTAKPHSSSLQAICEAFHVGETVVPQMNGYMYATLIAHAVIKMAEVLDRITTDSEGHKVTYPPPIDWHTMITEFKAKRGTLLRIVDMPFTATTTDVHDWIKEMGVDTEPLLCKRELHIERLRPSGIAFIQFEKHEDALTLIMNKGVKIGGRAPYIESTTIDVLNASTTTSFPPDVDLFAASKSTMLRLGSLYWNTSNTDIITWCYNITGSLPIAAWMASLPDGKSTGVGWVKFADSAPALRLLQVALSERLPQLLGRSVIVDPSDDDEMEFAKGITVLSPFPDWVYVPVPITCVGLIIGKQGQRISNIAKKHNVKISAPRRGEHPVFAMFGKVQRVTAAKEDIENIIQQWMAENATNSSTSNRAPMNNPHGGSPNISASNPLPYGYPGVYAYNAAGPYAHNSSVPASGSGGIANSSGGNMHIYGNSNTGMHSMPYAYRPSQGSVGTDGYFYGSPAPYNNMGSNSQQSNSHHGVNDGAGASTPHY